MKKQYIPSKNLNFSFNNTLDLLQIVIEFIVIWRWSERLVRRGKERWSKAFLYREYKLKGYLFLSLLCAAMTQQSGITQGAWRNKLEFQEINNLDWYESHWRLISLYTRIVSEYFIAGSFMSSFYTQPAGCRRVQTATTHNLTNCSSFSLRLNLESLVNVPRID